MVEATGPNRLIYHRRPARPRFDAIWWARRRFSRAGAQGIRESQARAGRPGATFNDVVKLNNYLVDMSHIAIFREVRDTFLNVEAPPATTTVEISRFARRAR